MIYRCCSEYEVLEEGDVELVRAEAKKVIRHHGRYMTYYPYYEDPTMVTMDRPFEFVDVVVFPGN